MRLKLQLALAAAIVLLSTAAIAFFIGQNGVAVLQPAGPIASQERDIMVIAVWLGILVVIPVFMLTFFIVWRYRESNPKGKYVPEQDHNLWLETMWWAIPCIIIGILSVITWYSSHALDPFKPLASNVKPMTVQVVALPWKWLFIYPEQGIATLNYVQFPAGTPIDFQLTADAPMNSFWIPQLGGQIYAMSGMSTHLHLLADKPGEFRGSSANLSGSGFAGMNFTARASNNTDFAKWVKIVRLSPERLSFSSYQKLAKPSRNLPTADYSAVDNNLYDKVVRKYTAPATGIQHSNDKRMDHKGEHH